MTFRSTRVNFKHVTTDLARVVSSRAFEPSFRAELSSLGFKFIIRTEPELDSIMAWVSKIQIYADAFLKRMVFIESLKIQTEKLP